MRVSIPMIVAEGSRIKNVVFSSNRHHFSLFSSFDLKFSTACIAVNKMTVLPFQVNGRKRT